MPTELAAADTANFLAGIVIGLVVMLATLTIPFLARLALLAALVALGALFIADGPAGLLRWIQFAVAQITKVAPLVTGMSAGKLLAGILLNVARGSRDG